MFNRPSLKIAALTILALGWGAESLFAAPAKIRIGHFSNVTHAPALIARATQHFESRLGEGVQLEWKTFNAGPEAIEALFASAIDILYVGPNPAVNGYIRSKGDALRIVSGVAAGGSGFVIRQDAGIERFEDIRGKRVASPQKANTQDVALHHLMLAKGLVSKTQGGDVEVFHLAGGDQMTAFIKQQIDAIWTAEPWLTRLVAEANGKILFEEGELWPDALYATTVLVVRRKFMEAHPDLTAKWVQAHVEITDWINSNSAQAKKLFNEEFTRETRKSLPPAYLDRFFARVQFTTDPMEFSVHESAERALAIGYLGKQKLDLTNLYELSFLKEASSQEEKKA